MDCPFKNQPGHVHKSLQFWLPSLCCDWQALCRVFFTSRTECETSRQAKGEREETVDCCQLAGEQSVLCICITEYIGDTVYGYIKTKFMSGSHSFLFVGTNWFQEIGVYRRYIKTGNGCLPFCLNRMYTQTKFKFCSSWTPLNTQDAVSAFFLKNTFSTV